MKRLRIYTQPSRILAPDKISDNFVFSLLSLSKCSQISELTGIRNATQIWPRVCPDDQAFPVCRSDQELPGRRYRDDPNEQQINPNRPYIM
jgi:hypothetical protein